ncbi:MAG: hypothetical protein IKS44_07535, partial [Bacteroidales bacterium]|nr:hypothetical protein [Bacteroidales bacterium]
QRCYEVPVGFKHISAKMAETGAIIGGESSGGLAVRGHISGKDGIYAAALLIEMLAVTGKSVLALYQEIIDRYGNLQYCEKDYRMTPARKQPPCRAISRQCIGIRRKGRYGDGEGDARRGSLRFLQGHPTRPRKH